MSMLLENDHESIGMLYNLVSTTIAPNSEGNIVFGVKQKGEKFTVKAGEPDKMEKYGMTAMIAAPAYEPFALGNGPRKDYTATRFDPKKQMMRDALRRMLDEV